MRRSKRFWSGLWSDLIIEQVMMKSLKSRGGLTSGRGMTESVRHQWVHSLHRCSAIHTAMTIVTNLGTKSSEQHEEMGNSRLKRDHADMKKVVNWFTQHDPFDDNVSVLRSLSTGIIAKIEDGINCHKAENVGKEIQESIDDIKYADVKIMRTSKVKTLATLYSNIKVGQQKVTVQPMILFTRLVVMAH